MTQRLLSISQAAELLGVCPDTIRRLGSSGKLKLVRVARRVLVPAEEIDRIAEQGDASVPQRARTVRHRSS